MKTLLPLLIILSFIFLSCENTPATSTKQALKFEPYDFQIKSFDWEPVPYKFSGFIQDSILTKKGQQYASWEYSYIGNIPKMLETWDIGRNDRIPLNDKEIGTFNNYKGKNAYEYILSKSKDHHITIINEAHQMPQHRVFTTKLLQDLYKQGYRHLGLESYFGTKKVDSTLVADQYPSIMHGFYLKEPQYANIIREALKIGFQIFAYESMGHENGKGREINQAKNIQTYMEKHPNEKILIHCGFDHAMEGVYGGKWEKAMAGRLTEFTDIDPLTISQTRFSEKSVKAYEDPYFQFVDVAEPTVFINKDDESFGRFHKRGSYVDIAIFHPRTKNFDRPEWLIYGDRKMYDIDLSDANIEGTLLVYAFKDGEKIGTAVPYDLQETKNKKVKLILGKGKYNIILNNEKNESLLTVFEAN